MEPHFRKVSKNGTKKYPASEYSDRILNLNKLEERNLENAIKNLEKERNTVINSIDKDIRKLEKDIDERDAEIRQANNLVRKKYLNNNLHNNLLINNRTGFEKYKKIKLSKKFKYSSNPNLIDNENDFEKTRSNLSALPRLTKNYTDPAISTIKEKKVNILPRSSSSIDIFKSNSLSEIKSHNINKENRLIETRPNSSDFETRIRNRIELKSSLENLTILPKAPILISENVIKKSFRSKNSSFDSNITDDEKIRNISPLPLLSSPVLKNNFEILI